MGVVRRQRRTAQNITVTAQDDYGNTVASYTGDKTLTFSGANASTDPATAPTVTDKTGAAVAFGTDTTITFNNGVAGTTGGQNSMTLYRAETATVAVTDGSISATGSDRLSVVVSPALRRSSGHRGGYADGGHGAEHHGDGLG